MNKQELIEKIKANGEWFETNRYVKITKVIELINQMDEPQKVKVPAFVAEWFEENKHNLNYAIYELCEAGKVPVDLYEGLTNFERWFYLNHDIDTLIRMQDGYEVEEEPKWIVRIGKIYLTGNQSYSFCKEDSTVFEIEKFAEEAAEKTGGKVEKV